MSELSSASGYTKQIDDVDVSDVVFNLPEYVSRRLPMQYPFGGLLNWRRFNLTIHLWYDLDAQESDEDLELRAQLTQFGSAAAPEYRLSVWADTGYGGSTLNVHIDRIRGLSRWWKIQLLLKSAGISGAQIVRWTPRGKADDIDSVLVSSSLEGFPPVDAAIVGGLTRRFASELVGSAKPLLEGGGEACVWKVYQVGKRDIALVSYPYGTLAKHIGQYLGSRSEDLFFVGSCGSFSHHLAKGDVVLPNRLKCISGVDNTIENILAGQADLRDSMHLSVYTPLQETGKLVASSLREGVLTADCEASWFAHGVFSGTGRGSRQLGVALFVTDEAWRSGKGLTDFRYRERTVKLAGARCVAMVKEALSIR